MGYASTSQNDRFINTHLAITLNRLAAKLIKSTNTQWFFMVMCVSLVGGFTTNYEYSYYTHNA